MKIIFLGTSGAIPTLYRNLPSVALVHDGEVMLFDCGEYTQIQIIRASIRIGKLEKIFISHLHGDHVTGLPGLLMLLNHASRERPLEVYGPPGIKNYVFSNKNILNFYAGYRIEVIELEAGTSIKGKGYNVETFSLDHTTYTLGFRYVEDDKPGKLDIDKTNQLGVPVGPLLKKLKNGEDVTLADNTIVRSKDVVGPPSPGRRIVYAVDTRPAKFVEEYAKGADLLIHDGMFADDLAEEALKRGHSTTSMAAGIALSANVKNLVLTHISPRYTSSDLMLSEARAVFERTSVAYDLMEMDLPSRHIISNAS